jgi:non-ribosomal peptide synthetase component F
MSHVLHHQANQWAHWLQKQGVNHHSIVAVYLPRSLELVVMMLAILKTGAAYLPIDSKQPVGRVKTMLENSQAVLCVTNCEQLSALKKENLSCPIFSIQQPQQAAASKIYRD